MKNTLIVLALITGLISCESEIISGNTPPVDETIEDITIQNYINKLYISLLGREPDSVEIQLAFTDLRNSEFSISARKSLIQTIQEGSAYHHRFYERARADLLNGLDTNQINQRINTLVFLYSQTQNQDEKDAYAEEIGRLDTLRKSDDHLISGLATQAEVYARCIDNSFYDEINMGADNFVISSFQHFLFRYPTTEELENGRNMVNGFEASLFLKTGNSKDQYLDIFFEHSGYFEGQVRQVFNRQLYREPTQAELVEFTQDYYTSGNYPALEREILSLDEYAGL